MSNFGYERRGDDLKLGYYVYYGTELIGVAIRRISYRDSYKWSGWDNTGLLGAPIRGKYRKHIAEKLLKKSFLVDK